MDTVRTLENQLVEFNKGLPKLPKGLTAWLAEYGWIFVLIGVVLSVLSLVTIVPTISTIIGVSSLLNFQSYGFYTLGWLSLLLSIVNLLIVIYLEGVAIAPLKDKKYRGWTLIFIASLVSIVFGVAGSLITLQLGSLVVGVLFYAIGLYVLFQVREHFVAHTTKEKVATTKPAFKAAAVKPKK